MYWGSLRQCFVKSKTCFMSRSKMSAAERRTLQQSLHLVSYTHGEGRPQQHDQHYQQQPKRTTLNCRSNATGCTGHNVAYKVVRDPARVPCLYAQPKNIALGKPTCQSSVYNGLEVRGRRVLDKRQRPTYLAVPYVAGCVLIRRRSVVGQCGGRPHGWRLSGQVGTDQPRRSAVLGGKADRDNNCRQTCGARRDFSLTHVSIVRPWRTGGLGSSVFHSSNQGVQSDRCASGQDPRCQ